LLAEPLRAGGFMTAWENVRSLTAPLFLFIAGFSLAIATVPRISEYRHFSSRLWRRISKIIFIIAVRYVLRLPFFSLQKTIAAIGSPAWDAFLNVDILQCIGISLLLLQAVFSIRLKGTVRTAILIAAVTGILAAAPRIGSASWVRSLPAFVRYYFTGSLFPLFPFAAYCLFGSLCGMLFLVKRSSWVFPAFVTALSLVVLALVCTALTSYSPLCPGLLRCAILLLLTVLMYFGEDLWERVPSWILVFGQESLVLYVLHIMAIYGSVFNKGIVHVLGSALSFVPVYSVFILLLMILSLIACAWHYVKRIQPDAARSFRYALYITFLIRFVTRPY
jgi:uncharacterized membrane protein